MSRGIGSQRNNPVILEISGPEILRFRPMLYIVIYKNNLYYIYGIIVYILN